MTKRNSQAAAQNAEKPRFDVNALRKAAGAKVFGRGVEYYEDGQVEIVSIEGLLVVADVFGSEVYRTELEGADGELSRSCTCPAFSDMGFCKHLVATALAANDPAIADPVTDRYARLRDRLHKLETDALVELIIDAAKRDTTLLNEIDLVAATDDGDDETLFVRFEKAISDAAAVHEYIDFRHASAWANGVETVFRRVEKLIEGNRAALVLRLMDEVFSHLEEAFESIDDSDGHCGAVYQRACEIHLDACEAARPDPVQLARFLFEHEVRSNWDYFYAANDTYADVLGTRGQEEYERLARAAWAKLKPIRGGESRLGTEWSGERHHIGAILERIAERNGDVDARIAIRAKSLSSAHAYVEVARICLDAGRETDALHWAEEGLWKFEDEHDRLLVVFAARLYRRMGRAQDGDKLLWTTFSKEPTLHLYEDIKALEKGKPAAAKAVYDRAVEVLTRRIAKAGKRHAYFDHPAFLLVQILISGRDFAEAWKIAHAYELSPFLVEELAEASAGTHPAEALRAYEKLVEDRIQSGQGNYDEAAKLIARMRDIRDGMGDHEPHLAYVRSLIQRHKAKRNFVKLMRAKGYTDQTAA